jgi:hypothetical protein
MSQVAGKNFCDFKEIQGVERRLLPSLLGSVDFLEFLG